jgi:acyl-CoA thioesterase-2
MPDPVVGRYAAAPMGHDVTDFATLMRLEPHGPDVFVGVGPAYPWGGLYGGQIVAQALRAACFTVEPDRFVHSLHAYFIRSGDSSEPIRFEVDRIRNGRSFVTRRVIARQSVGPILNLSASFQIREDQADVQERSMPQGLPDPDALAADDWGPILQRRPMEPESGPSRARAWLRVTPPVGEDPVLQACALAYASDDYPTEAASRSHPRHRDGVGGSEAHDPRFVSASLDHAVWFHRPGRHDEWVLHDFEGRGLTGARGLAIGEVFSRDGVHLATVAQEILLRERTR